MTVDIVSIMDIRVLEMTKEDETVWKDGIRKEIWFWIKGITKNQFSYALILMYSCLVSFYSMGQNRPEITFDHVILFVSDSTLETAFANELFTLAEKLTSVHKEQGTRCKYYLFHNTYLELLYLGDREKAKTNTSRFGTDYTLS